MEYVKKSEVINDLKFCKSLADRLVKYAENTYRDDCYDRHHTVIQDDIRRLRRELNDVSKKLDWDYEPTRR